MRVPNILLLISLCANSGFADFSAPMVPRDIATAFSGLVGSVTDAFTPNNHQLESFWDMAQKLGPQAGQVVLDEVSKVSSEVANAVVEFKDATTAVVQHAHKLHRDIQDIIEKKGITIEHVSELLSREISEVYENLKDEVNDSLPQDRGEKARARAKLLNQVMEKVQVAYIHVLTEVGLPREETEAHFKNFAPRVVHLMLVIGNIADEHPMVLQALVFAAAMFFLQDIQILRPIMLLLGFGPLGPIRGTLAALVQRLFFGGTIPAGNWFAILQSVGMTLTGSWLQKLAASVGLAAALGLATDDRGGH